MVPRKRKTWGMRFMEAADPKHTWMLIVALGGMLTTKHQNDAQTSAQQQQTAAVAYATYANSAALDSLKDVVGLLRARVKKLERGGTFAQLHSRGDGRAHHDSEEEDGPPAPKNVVQKFLSVLMRPFTGR